jgi:type VI protein secretion system component VasK
MVREWPRPYRLTTIRASREVAVEWLWVLAFAAVVTGLLAWVTVTSWRARATDGRYDHSVDESGPDPREQRPPAA